MFAISIPIWWDKYAAGVREARLRHAAADLEAKDKANLLSADLKMALYRLRDANRRVNLYRQVLVPRAQQSLRAVESAYRTGGAAFNDMIDLQRMLLEFQLAGERALVDQAQRLAEVEMLVGREIPQAMLGGPSTQPASRPAPEAASQPTSKTPNG
jgi:outer membrane protein TolC